MLSTFLDRMRRRRVAIMQGRGKIERFGEATYDPETRTSTPGTATLIWKGRGDVTPTARGNREPDEHGGGVIVESPYMATLPYDATGMQNGDIYTSLVSPDTEMQGRTFRIATVTYDDRHVARILGLEEVDES